MRFKAEILGLLGESKFKDIGMVEPGHNKPFRFTKSKIYFTSQHKNDAYYIHLNRTNGELQGAITDKCAYTFSKDYDRDDKKRFIISLYDLNHAAYLKLNWWNRIKCNIVHKRYLFQREGDWFWKTVITACIGFIFSLIGIIVGYYLRGRTEQEPKQEQPQPRTQPAASEKSYEGY